MTLKNLERRRAEWLQIALPVRVLSFDLEHFETGGFSEDTHTLKVNRSGASVALRNPVTAGDSLRIVNLTNHGEADFRVVGAVGATEDGVVIWAVEFELPRDDFWGVVCPPPSGEISDETYGLQCRVCGASANYFLSIIELEVLGSAGTINLSCPSCGKPTSWITLDPNRPQRNSMTADVAASPPRAIATENIVAKEKRVENRAAKRTGLNLQILVRNQAGEQEVSKVIDISKLGVKVGLFMKLEVGDTVKIICPYDPRSGGIEQTAEVRWRSRYYNQDFPRTYGIRHIR